MNTLRCQYGNLKMVFIDEISMCGTNMLNFINNRLQEIMGVRTIFGGLSVICIGDLHQLRPIGDTWIFHQPTLGLAILGPNLWKDKFKLFELTKIMRQKDDKQFAEALNRLREGIQTAQDVALFKTRCLKKTNPEYDLGAPHIMHYNRDVNAHNNSIYAAAKTNKAIHEAVDIVIGNVTSAVKDAIKKRAPIKAGDAMGLAKDYRTAVGLRNEMTVNMDVNDGLVNGSGGVVRYIQCNATNVPVIIWVEFDDIEVGQQLRSASRSLYTSPHIDKSWTPIKTVTRQFQVGKNKDAKLHRRQFPLQMSCAKTVYRSQGDTLPKLMVQLPDEKRTHMHYVALSCVTKMQNLGIIGKFDASKITVDHEVKEEMRQLRYLNRVQLCYTPLYTLGEDQLKIVFHNCQSLPLHIEDIRSDNNIAAADIVVLVETKLASTDHDRNLGVPTFQLYRNDYSPQRSAYGSVIYYKRGIIGNCKSVNYGDVEITLMQIHKPFRIQVAGVYCRPKETATNIYAALQHLHNLLSDDPVVILGDFNVNIINDDDHGSRQLLRYMRNLQYRQLINEVTTNGGTAIDHIYTNLDDAVTHHGCLESYTSYHKLLWFTVDKDVLPKV